MRTLATLLCTIPSIALSDVPKVVTDILPIHSIASAVMGDLGKPDVLLPAGGDPHVYALKPSDARALAEADLLVIVGFGLTPWLEDIESPAKRIELGEADGTLVLPIREDAGFEAHDHDHGDDGHHDEHDDDHTKEEGHDDHGHDDHDHAKEEDHDDDHAGHDDHAEGGDPHLWLDPKNAAAWADALATELAEMDPENADTYFANAARFAADLAEIEAQISDELSSPPQFLLTHDNLQYFESRFDVAAMGAATDIDDRQASAARIAELRQLIAERGAPDCLLVEPGETAGLLQRAAGNDVPVVTYDALGTGIEPGAGFYGALLKGISGALASCKG